MPQTTSSVNTVPDLAAVRAAHERIRPFIHRTPMMTSRSLDEAAGAKLFFKCENFQKVGAFKARGACNAVFSLTDAEAARGIVTQSSGNHGAAVAYAAGRRGVPAWVVMQENTLAFKQANVRALGGQLRLCASVPGARQAMCDAVQAETGATLVHPFNDPRVIAGQGTAALELLEDFPDLDAVIAPVGGGGLLSGIAVAAKGVRPGIKVYGGEPAMADDAAQSLKTGKIVPQDDPRTVADGLLTSLGDKTFAILRGHVDAIGTASEEAILGAMRLAWERLKIIIEPSSAVPLAVLLDGGLPLKGLRVGVILTGGNVDLARLPWQA